MVATAKKSQALPLTLTKCAVCGRKLKDALSVQIGMGPTCRERNGYKPDELNDQLRAVANTAIRMIALQQTGEGVMKHLAALRTIGWNNLADAIERRVAKAQATKSTDGKTLEIRCNKATADVLFADVPGFSKPKDAKRGFYTAPVAALETVKATFKMLFPVELVLLPNGLQSLKPGWEAPPSFDVAFLKSVGTKLLSHKSDRVKQGGATLVGLATATEQDWRPDSTLPEDFYAL
jgi:hypothetical protein